MKFNKYQWTLLFITLLTSAGYLLSGCAVANGAQETTKIYQVGLLSVVDTLNPAFDGFKATMTDLGYKEGENISYDFQAASSSTDTEKIEQIAEKFVADKVDLIVTTTNGAAIAAKAATADTHIPVVFMVVFAPIEAGIADNVRQPGGNVTGVHVPLEDVAKQLEFLLQMAPHVKRVWIPFNPKYITGQLAFIKLQPVASALGVELVEGHFDNPEAVAVNLESRGKIDDIGFEAILLMPEVISGQLADWKAISTFATEHHMPIAANSVVQVRDGGLFSYTFDSVDIGKQAAFLADKILRGTEAGTIPLFPIESHLIINYKAAQSLGLKVGDGLLAQATEIIR